MLIFLNGSINSGKTTVAKILATKLSNIALVEIDSLRAMIDWMPIDQAVPLNLKNAVSVIRNFFSSGLNVVVPYPLSQENYDYMMDNLKDLKNQIYVFTLSPQLDKVLTNRGERDLDDWERDRIKHHYNIGINKPAFGEIIDNSNQTPEETADYIISQVSKL